MPNIFHKCHAYNKVFFRNLNKLAFLSTFYLDPYGAYSFSKFLGGCKMLAFPVREKGNNFDVRVSCVMPEMLRHEHISLNSCR